MTLGTAHPHISGLNGLDGLDGLDGLGGLGGLALCLHHTHAMIIFFENENEVIVGSQ
jgi:hypothetical protein